jgi:hypothetical protein
MMPLPSSIDWPDALGCAQRASYRGSPQLSFATIEVQDGPPRFRLSSSEEKRIYTMTFTFTTQQLALFEFFYHDTLDSGGEWFNMPVLTGLGMIPYLCHFSGERTVTPHPDLIDRFNVSFDVEAYSTGYTPPPPFAPDDPMEAGTPSAPSFDVYDARSVMDTRPTDIVNSLTPSVFV